MIVASSDESFVISVLCELGGSAVDDFRRVFIDIDNLHPSPLPVSNPRISTEENTTHPVFSNPNNRSILFHQFVDAPALNETHLLPFIPYISYGRVPRSRDTGERVEEEGVDKSSRKVRNAAAKQDNREGNREVRERDHDCETGGLEVELSRKEGARRQGVAVSGRTS